MNRILRSSVAAVVLVLVAAQTAGSQSSSFDMSPEKPAAPPQAAPQPLPPQQPVQPPQAATPAPTVPVQPANPPVQTPASPVQAAPKTPAPAPVVPPSASANASQSPSDNGTRRYLIPGASLVLDGEYSRRSWSIYLSEQQAGVPARLELAYQNSIVIAPEVSKLTVLVNGRRLVDEAISSPDSSRSVVLDVPAGTLRPGANLVEFRATQRHRTDCDIRSTYDLWTDIDPARTFLSFQRNAVDTSSIAEAIRAVGPDATGKTEFQILMPAVGQPGTAQAAMRLTQGLSLLSGMPNQAFSYRSSDLMAAEAGRFGVVIGTAAELQPVFPQLPPVAQTAGFAALAPDPKTGSTVLLISGPSWESIRAAIDTIVSPLERPLGVRRDVMATQRWTAPDAPLLFGGETVPLSQMGVETIEFPGRRLRTSFNIAVPADFYANAYGEARLLLDAAFASSVKPGSHVDIYVNGNIASTVPITSSKGGIFRHLPIKVTLRHIRPGINNIGIEAVIITDEDKACAPGATATTEPRLAIFNTSEWQMPTFARIGQTPNLAALAGTGSPYGRMTDPLLLSIDRFDPDTMGAASTFMAQLALVAGHPIQTELLASMNAVGDRNAVFIGSASQMPPKLLAQLNVAPETVTAWRPTGDVAVASGDANSAFDEWRSRLRGGAWTGQISAFNEWLRRNFDLSSSSLQFIPGSETLFQPTPVQSLVLAQGVSPDGKATWTVLTAPTPEELRQGVEAITAQEKWQTIAGRLEAYAGKTGELTTVPASRFNFLPTSTPSLNNYRLIIANWLSTNILSYAVLLVVLSTLLGIATAAMLSNLGRRK